MQYKQSTMCNSGSFQYERAATPDIGEERRRQTAAANEYVIVAIFIILF